MGQPESRPRSRRLAPSVTFCEPRVLLSGVRARAAAPAADSPVLQLTAADVQTILSRAAGATSSEDGIIAVVDRTGKILGVRAEAQVDPTLLSNPDSLTFAVDGAVAKARTGAMFGNGGAPLTSRTIQFISQSTMISRVIESSPDGTDPNAIDFGPGFVAPIGVKSHFPPGVRFTPQVDLFLIEHTNRDSIIHPGPDGLRGTTDDIALPNRFNIPDEFLGAGVELTTPESYGFVSGIAPNAQARGIATLPGGIPIVRNGQIVGGVGVFYPGSTGFATAENSILNDAGFFDPSKPDRTLEAEFSAFVAVGGSLPAGVPVGPAPFGTADGFTLRPFGRIDLVGITLPLVGGHGLQGVKNLLKAAAGFRPGDPASGTDLPVTTDGQLALPGTAPATGWLVTPHDSPTGGLTADDVRAMVERGIVEANRVRAAIRLPLDNTAKMVFSVTDEDGNVLGLYRMPDATTFSIDVAVAKARNVAYYADANAIQPEDVLTNVPAGTAFTNRTFRYVTLPRFPQGIDGYAPGPFSILNDPGTLSNGRTVEPTTPSQYTSIQGFDAFHPGSNFHDPSNPANQNGIVFFPGSAPVYKDTNGDGIRELVGGLGVSGDGVDQDDDVTFEAATDYNPPFNVRRADQVKVRDVRLPYQKFNRQPHVPINGQTQALSVQVQTQTGPNPYFQALRAQAAARVAARAQRGTS